MDNITYINDSLFNAPKGSILIHAVNCRGVWGSGIAKEFAKRFPEEQYIYSTYCAHSRTSDILGTCFSIPAKEYIIGCLFTSKNYGQKVDSPDKILEATKLAIDDLISQNITFIPMHMCKINSGLFNVPWEDTEAILKATGQKFTVYDYSRYK